MHELKTNQGGTQFVILKQNRESFADLFLFTAAKNYGHKLYITNENKEWLGLIVDHF